MPPSPRGLAKLPPPSEEETTVSTQVTALIEEEIRRHGPVAFGRFMELALYAPGLGYYTAGKEKFGARGDFITAPETFPLFGRCIAHTAAEIFAQLGDAEILEVGAGSGRLAVELLRELARLDALPRTYYILDLSPHLRVRQTETLKEHAPELCGRVRWLDRLPASFRGLVIGNELLDAMPVERFRMAANGLEQLRVTRQDGRLTWIGTAAEPALVERIAPLGLAPGYISEVGFAAEAWIRSAADILESGVLLLIDYGFPRAEFYHPDRAGGTLMCHYRHRAHGDPLILVGLQDITAHIDFTAIAEAGTETGLDLLGYTSQAAFLIGNGLDRLVTDVDLSDVRAHLALTDQIKKLTLPHEMGELYKVMALGRGISKRLSAFSLQDRRSRL